MRENCAFLVFRYIVSNIPSYFKEVRRSTVDKKNQLHAFDDMEPNPRHHHL